MSTNTYSLKKLSFLAIATFLTFFYSGINAQTSLYAGDVAFISCQTNNSTADTFAIVLLKDIASGTQIGFTDGCYKDANGYNILTSTKTEWYFLWQASSSLSAGTIIKFWTSVAAASNGGGAANASTGTIVQGVGLSLNNNGGTDQVFAFQGISSLDTTNPYRVTVTRYLAGIHLDYIGGLTSDANWDGTSSAAGLFQSELPDSLVNGTHALRLDSTNVKRENAVMTSNILSLDKTVINNKTNWTLGNTPQSRAVPVRITWNGSAWDGTPSSSVDCIINSNTAPGTTTCRSLRVDNGYNLTVTSGNVINIYGDLYNYGNGLGSSNGDVEFYKTGTANLYGSMIDFEGIIRVSSSTTLATNSLLTLAASSATSYGQIGSGGSLNGSISGNITCEYYIGGGGAGWRSICSPVGGATLAQINDDVPLYFSTPDPNYANVYRFDESGSAPHWAAASGLSQSMDAGGFALYLRNSNLPLTIDITGTYQGTSNYTLSGLTSTGSNNDTTGWHIIRNPWPTGFYWDGSIANVQGTAAYFYDQSTGTYTAYDNISDGVIPPFTAFTIKVTSNNVSVTLPNNSRNVAIGTNFFDKTVSVENFVELSLKNMKTGVTDIARFYTDSTAQNGFDVLDGFKKMNDPAAPNIYIVSEDKRLSKDVWNSIPEKGIDLPVAVSTQSTGKHQLIAAMENIERGIEVYLEDKLSGKLYDIAKGAFTFEIEAGDVAERFVLHIRKKSATAIENAEAADFFIGSNGTSISIGTTTTETLEVEVIDLLGKTMYKGAIDAQAGQTTMLPELQTMPGYYIVKVAGSAGMQINKVYLK
jgi:hypothetical protein